MLGENGAGKTTAIRGMLGLDRLRALGEIQAIDLAPGALQDEIRSMQMRKVAEEKDPNWDSYPQYRKQQRFAVICIHYTLQLHSFFFYLNVNKNKTNDRRTESKIYQNDIEYYKSK